MITGATAAGVAGSIMSAPGLIIAAALVLLSGASFLYATRTGKFAVWESLFRALGLGGDEHVIDIGCGRGAVLLRAAQLVPGGRAVGVDLWRSVDQSGNAEVMTRRNAELEGVSDRIELHTADMTALPFEDAAFDVVLSSLAVHNIKDREGRAKAVEECSRVLRPGGRLVIADIQHVDDYAKGLRELGMSGVSACSAGWRGWFGGPWMATKIVTAQKPVPSNG